MILGVQCGCRVVPWKDRGYSIEPCPLHAVADDLLEALKAILDCHIRSIENEAWENAQVIVEEVQS